MPGLLWCQLLSVIKNDMYFVDEVWALCGTELSASEEQSFLECMDRIWAQVISAIEMRDSNMYNDRTARLYIASLAQPCNDMLCHPHQTSLAAFLGARGIADSIDHGNPNSRMHWALKTKIFEKSAFFYTSKEDLARIIYIAQDCLTVCVALTATAKKYHRPPFEALWSRLLFCERARNSITNINGFTRWFRLRVLRH
ncbi:hypothetical protein K438DRAFT_1767414 [Mycena galopus ATCC 62051]|nr:hypothetical protein K438DRAFT_1767414 [Mycena galopus ATCC 62051]